VQSELARITKLFTDDAEPPVRTPRIHRRRKNRKTTNTEGHSMINEILDTENEKVLPVHKADELETDPLSWKHFVYRRPWPVSKPLECSEVAGHIFEDFERLQVVKAEKRPHVSNSNAPKEAMQTEILDPFMRAPLGGGKLVPSYYAASSSKREH
jgi:hypothetical protein